MSTVVKSVGLDNALRDMVDYLARPDVQGLLPVVIGHNQRTFLDNMIIIAVGPRQREAYDIYQEHLNT